MAYRLACDMHENCVQPVTHIDNKGFVYCTEHGLNRRWTHPCRKLRPHELNRLKSGKAVERY